MEIGILQVREDPPHSVSSLVVIPGSVTTTTIPINIFGEYYFGLLDSGPEISIVKRECLSYP